MRKNALLLLIMLIIFGSLLSGCFKGEQSQKQIDVPEEVTEDMGEAVNASGEEEATLNETVARELYLLDKDGLVVPQLLELPKIESKAVATQVLTYLIKEGPVTEILPNGFEAVIPAGTEVLGLSLQEGGTLIVDVSEEFKDYAPEEELKIIEAMTFTLTQFENVERIQLRINGEDQAEMPVDGTPISQGYSRNNGVNIYLNDAPDLKHSKVVTMYYPKENNQNMYYVPVTQYLNTLDSDLNTLIVQTLLDGPAYDLQVTDVFNDNTSLVDDPHISNGVLQLIFTEEILKNQEEAIIADEVVETLIRTFSGQSHIEAVELKVENQATLMNESGEIYSEPVLTKSDANKLPL